MFYYIFLKCSTFGYMLINQCIRYVTADHPEVGHVAIRLTLSLPGCVCVVSDARNILKRISTAFHLNLIYCIKIEDIRS